MALQTLCSTLQAQGVAEAEYPFKRDIEKGRYDKVVAKLEHRLSRDSDNLGPGTDAIVESQTIEDKVFNIESDMWEY